MSKTIVTKKKFAITTPVIFILLFVFYIIGKRYSSN